MKFVLSFLLALALSLPCMAGEVLTGTFIVYGATTTQADTVSGQASRSVAIENPIEFGSFPQGLGGLSRLPRFTTAYLSVTVQPSNLEGTSSIGAHDTCQIILRSALGASVSRLDSSRTLALPATRLWEATGSLLDSMLKGNIIIEITVADSVTDTTTAARALQYQVNWTFGYKGYQP